MENDFKGVKFDNVRRLAIPYKSCHPSISVPRFQSLGFSRLSRHFLRVCVQCGLHNDMDHYAELMNATGKAFLVERSDQGHGTP